MSQATSRASSRSTTSALLRCACPSLPLSLIWGTTRAARAVRRTAVPNGAQKRDAPPLPAPGSTGDHIQNAIDFYQRLQSDDGHWSNDYGGPMFLMPGEAAQLERS